MSIKRLRSLSPIKGNLPESIMQISISTSSVQEDSFSGTRCLRWQKETSSNVGLIYLNLLQRLGNRFPLLEYNGALYKGRRRRFKCSIYESGSLVFGMNVPYDFFALKAFEDHLFIMDNSNRDSPIQIHCRHTGKLIGQWDFSAILSSNGEPSSITTFSIDEKKNVFMSSCPLHKQTTLPIKKVYTRSR